MQLAMTTKLMVLCSKSQWVWSRPNTWIKCYTWCPATSLECEVHPHFITQSPWLTFIHYVAYITGWLSEALITHGAWSMLNMIDHASRKQVLELHFYLTYPDEFAPVIISVDHACSAIYLFSWLAWLRKSVQKMSVFLNVIHACMWQSEEVHRRGKKIKQNRE